MERNISIIVPMYNEADSIEILHKRIVEAVAWQYKYEIIFVDDGSKDNTINVINDLHSKDDRVKYV